MCRRSCAVAFVLAALLVNACAHGSVKDEDDASSPPAKLHKKGEVVVGPGAFANGQPGLLAWLAYGVGKTGLYGKPRPRTANDSADDFDLELGARESQCEFWERYRKTPEGKPWPELDRQVEIWRAGFLPELVVAIFSHPGWTIPASTIAGLRLEEFAKRFPGSYEGRAAVVVAGPNGRLFAEVPGKDFPGPPPLPYGPASCGRLLDERRAAWARWAELEPRLGGAPVGADFTLDFGAQLIAMKRDSGRVGRGATWVSPRVATLALLEGFCANEEKDWARALGWLDRAISMRPTSPEARLEQSMALLMSGKRQEALAVADALRLSSDDGCTVAGALRRRGYILVDLGDLLGARDAYQQSLALDPDSPVAIKELALIEPRLKASASGSAGAAPPLMPGPMRVTTCKRGARSAPAAP